MYRLLVADDEKKLLRGLCDFYPWDELGYQIVARVENGKQALEYIAKHPVDVVLTDISMPIMTGIELAGEIFREYSSVNVILLSGYSEFEYAQQAIRYGVYDYILKPVKTEELCRIFRSLKLQLDHEEKEYTDPGYYKNIVEIVNRYVRSNLQSANLESAALLVNLSIGYLSVLYKKEAEMTFSDYVLQSRMEKSKELLRNPSYKIYEIAENLGYENPKNFSRAFKEYYGMTPRDFRLNAGKFDE